MSYIFLIGMMIQYVYIVNSALKVHSSNIRFHIRVWEILWISYPGVPTCAVSILRVVSFQRFPSLKWVLPYALHMFQDFLQYSWFQGLMLQVRDFNSSRFSRLQVKRYVFLKILQNSQENICVGVSFLIKFTATLLKKRFWHRCFPVNFQKLLTTHFYRTPPGECF